MILTGCGPQVGRALTCQLLIGALLLTPSPAQTQIVAAREPWVVAIDSFAQAGSLTDPSYGRFFSDLVRVRLRDEPRLRVAAPSAKSRCFFGRATSTGQTDSIVPESTAPTYIVSGRIEVRPEVSRLEYSVTKCGTSRSDTIPRVLLTDVRSIPQTQGFTELTLAAQFIAGTIRDDLPRTKVAVRLFADLGPQAGKTGLAREVTHDVASAINRSADMEVADTGSYEVTGQLQLQPDGRLLAQIRVRDRAKTVDTLATVSGSINDYDAFSDRLQTQVVPFLIGVRTLDLRRSGGLSLPIRSLLDSARAALCVNAGPLCRVNIEGGLSAARAATQVDSTNADAWYLLGRAELERFGFRAARQALSHSSSLMLPGTPAQKRTDVYNALARALFATADYDSALTIDNLSLGIDPNQSEVSLARAEAQWFLGQRISALRSLMQQASVGHASGGVNASIAEHVMTLEPESVAAEPSLVEAACRMSGARERCLPWLHDQGMRLSVLDSTGERTRREIFQLLTRLQPDSTSWRVDAYGFIAVSYLGTERTDVVHVHNRDYLVGRVRGFQFDSANIYLQHAEAETTSTLQPRQLEWLRRLRALVQRNDALAPRNNELADRPLWARRALPELANAYSWTQRALLTIRTENGGHVAADILFQWARWQEIESASTGGPLADTTRKLYRLAADVLADALSKASDSGVAWAYEPMREVLHSLGQDTATASLLERLRTRSPRDLDVLWNLMFVYGEYMFDYRRRYDVEKTRLGLLHPATAEDSVDAAESALLVGEVDTARVLLISALSPRKDTLSTCYEMVAQFFSTWAALDVGGGTETAPLARWQTARTEYWKSTTPGACWVFNGVRHYLADEPREPRDIVSQLLWMLDAMAFRESALPTRQTH